MFITNRNKFVDLETELTDGDRLEMSRSRAKTTSAKSVEYQKDCFTNLYIGLVVMMRLNDNIIHFSFI